jgi:hypothetical protein
MLPRFTCSGLVTLLAAGLLLAGCAGQPLPLPAGWPLPQLAPPPDARPAPLSRLAPASRPYYIGGNDDSYQPAKEALERLLAPVRAGDAAGDDTASFANVPTRSVDGTPGHSWGIAFTSRSGWDTSLAQCEFALKPLNFEIQEYRPGRLRTYYSRDRRTEVDLIAGKDDRLLLCVNTYDQPMLSERQLAQREDLQAAAKALGDEVRTRAAEVAQGKRP